jgi:hypothetical protein
LRHRVSPVNGDDRTVDQRQVHARLCKSRARDDKDDGSAGRTRQNVSPYSQRNRYWTPRRRKFHRESH